MAADVTTDPIVSIDWPYASLGVPAPGITSLQLGTLTLVQWGGGTSAEGICGGSSKRPRSGMLYPRA